MSRQLALNVGLSDLASFENFHPGTNGEAAAAARETAAGRPGVLFLHGPAGTGKSHLLYAAVKTAAVRRPAVYVSRAAVEAGGDAWLDLDGDGLVCIDDLGERFEPTEARALFSLYERIRGRSGSLMLAGQRPPSAIEWGLPDLRSRAQSDLVYRLDVFTEAELEDALRLRAGHRGIHLSDDVVRFVLRRYERTPSALFRLLDRVDVELLAQKRRITVHFLRSLERERDA